MKMKTQLTKVVREKFIAMSTYIKNTHIQTKKQKPRQVSNSLLMHLKLLEKQK
jgi:hypothetical protein